MQAAPGQQSLVRYAQLTGLDSFVSMRGIPASRANACLTNEAELNRLVAMTQAAVKDHNVQGTPTFLINGETVAPPPAGTTLWDGLESKLKAELS